MTEMNKIWLTGKAAEEWKTLCDIIDDIDGDWKNRGDCEDTAARRIVAGITPRDEIIKIIYTLEFCVTVADTDDADAIIPTIDSLRKWDTLARLIGHTVPEAEWEHRIPAQLDRICQGVQSAADRTKTITLTQILNWAHGEMITVRKRLDTEEYDNKR